MKHTAVALTAEATWIESFTNANRISPSLRPFDPSDLCRLQSRVFSIYQRWMETAHPNNQSKMGSSMSASNTSSSKEKEAQAWSEKWWHSFQYRCLRSQFCAHELYIWKFQRKTVAWFWEKDNWSQNSQVWSISCSSCSLFEELALSWSEWSHHAIGMTGYSGRLWDDRRSGRDRIQLCFVPELSEYRFDSVWLVH